jgi:transposase
MEQISEALPVPITGGEPMQGPEEVAVMLRLQVLGWGTKRIAAELGCSRNTVRRYLRQGGWAPWRRPERAGVLAGLGDWLAEHFRQHRGNADVVRQELAREHGIVVSLRTVERAVRELRRELVLEAKATVRFETPPGRQLQIDFGTAAVEIGGEKVRVHLFVATLGYARRCFVAPFRHERQAAWLEGLEHAFRHFGGVPAEVLLDNPKALVVRHDPQTREVAFNERLRAFARYWGFQPRACAPYRARTKGKDESGVGYVKKNAIAGRRFASPREPPSRLPSLRDRIDGSAVDGPSSRRISPGGCARSPTGGCTAPPASRRSGASRARRRARCSRSPGGHRSARCASWRAGCRRMPASGSTPTPTACRGG